MPTPTTCAACGSPAGERLHDCVAARAPRPRRHLARDRSGRLRRVGSAVAVAVAVVVLLGGVTYGGLSLLAGDGTGNAATDVPPPVVPTPEEAPPAAPSAKPKPKPKPTTPFVCWNGEGAEELRACDLASGRDGAQWVFPAMANQICSEDSPGGGGRLQIWNCLAELPAGTMVEVNYSRWSSPGAAFAYYDTMERAERTDVVIDGWTRHRWAGLPARGAQGRFKGAMSYAEGSWGVTVYGPTRGARDRALDSLVRFRPPSQWRGIPR